MLGAAVAQRLGDVSESAGVDGVLEGGDGVRVVGELGKCCCFVEGEVAFGEVAAGGVVLGDGDGGGYFAAGGLESLGDLSGGDAEQAHLLDGVDLVGVVEAGAVLVLCPLGGEAVEGGGVVGGFVADDEDRDCREAVVDGCAVRRWPVRTRSWPSRCGLRWAGS
ncbi:hypothetical protein GS901_05470 [Rhodococcus hoagii]|nr:hypothetical protein [Prescottella equi]